MTMSKDKHKQVGCLILDPETLFIRATGYNGFPLGIEDTTERWERDLKYNYVQHAEMNAICSAARHGTQLKDSVCIVTYFPCSTCAKALIQAGCKAVVTKTPDYDHPRWGQDFRVSCALFQESGISVLLE